MEKTEDIKNNRLYRKLQQRLDKLPIGFPATDSGVEIRILKYLFEPIEAQVALGMNFLPEHLRTIFNEVKQCVSSEEELSEILERMVKKGAIVGHTTAEGSRVYSLIMLAIGMFEFQVNKLTPAFYKDFVAYLNAEFQDEVFNKKLPQLRLIPTEGSITPDLPIMPYDDIRALIPKLPRPLSVTNCICKQGHDMNGHPCKVTDKREICLIFGTGARHYRELGWGRYITEEELRSILNQAEKDGLVLQPSNSRKPVFICLCCGDCCEVLTTVKKFDEPASYLHNNYYAVLKETSATACTGCGRCVKRCQMDAVSIQDKKAVVDLTRCIGCGLCVPTCPVKVMHLEKSHQIYKPPKDIKKFFIELIRQRVGNARVIIMLTKRLFGRKIKI